MKTLLSVATLSVVGVSSSFAQKADRPNVIIIMTDQQRADLCGREGFPMAITPYVDSLARANCWFDKAYTVAPASSPARCSMLTGRYPSATRVRTNHNVLDVYYGKNMVQVFKENGYKTALVGKNHSFLKPADMDYWIEYGHWGKSVKDKTEVERQVAEFLDKEAQGQWLEPSKIPLERQQPVTIVNEALDWIKGQTEPFFLWVSFPEPHNPYQVCEPYYSMFAPDKIPQPRTTRKDLKYKSDKYRVLAELEDQSCPDLQKDLPRLRGNYMGMIRLIDDQVKRLVETMKADGKYENTLFIILSDHGDYCGEYGLIRKGAGTPDCLTRIPMVWAGVGIQERDAPMEACVSIADIFPTLCTAIGAEIPVGVQGRSLWPMLTGEKYPEREFRSVLVEQGFGGVDFTMDEPLTFEKEGALNRKGVARFDELNTWTQSGTQRMVRMGDWKLIIDNYGRGELYNLKKDPSEINNLYEDEECADKRSELLQEMMTWTLRLQDPLPVPRHRYTFKRTPYNYHFTGGE